MMPRRSQIIRPVTHAKRCLRRYQNLVAPSRNGLTENCFGQSVRINISRVKEIHAGFEANIDESGRFGHIARPPCFEELRSTAKRSRAEAEYGNLQSRLAKLSKFHIRHRCCRSF